MAEKIRIADQLNGLFPGQEVSVGSQSITVKPLGIGKLAQLSRKLKTIGEELSKDGVTWENYEEVENVVKIAILLLEKFPEVLEQTTNIHRDDIELLPLETVVELLSTVVDVNLASKEKLAKNFGSLVEKVGVSEKAVKPTKKK